MLQARVAVQPGFAGELIVVLLAEEQAEQAWRVGVEHVDQLSESQFLKLLEIRQASHPGDVLVHYATLIDRHLHDTRHKHRYRRAFSLLPGLRAAYLALGDPDRFDHCLHQLRFDHQRRPTFLAQLEAAGL